MKKMLLYILIGIICLLVGKVVLSLIVGTVVFGIQLLQIFLPIIIIGAGIMFIAKKMK